MIIIKGQRSQFGRCAFFCESDTVNEINFNGTLIRVCDTCAKSLARKIMPTPTHYIFDFFRRKIGGLDVRKERLVFESWAKSEGMVCGHNEFGYRDDCEKANAAWSAWLHLKSTGDL